MIINAYPLSLQKILSADIDLTGADLVALLLESGYTYDATDEFVDDLSNEVTGGSYARQSIALTTGADTTNEYAYVVPPASITFAGVTATAIQYVVIAKNSGADATSPVILCADLETTYALTAKSFRVSFPGNLMEIG